MSRQDAANGSSPWFILPSVRVFKTRCMCISLDVILKRHYYLCLLEPIMKAPMTSTKLQRYYRILLKLFDEYRPIYVNLLSLSLSLMSFISGGGLSVYLSVCVCVYAYVCLCMRVCEVHLRPSCFRKILMATLPMCSKARSVILLAA